MLHRDDQPEKTYLFAHPEILQQLPNLSPPQLAAQFSNNFTMRIREGKIPGLRRGFSFSPFPVQIQEFFFYLPSLLGTGDRQYGVTLKKCITIINGGDIEHTFKVNTA